MMEGVPGARLAAPNGLTRHAFPTISLKRYVLANARSGARS